MTVIFYLSILSISTLFIYFSENGKGLLERRIFRLIAFLIIFIPSAIRYNVGKDYESYVRIYQNIEYINDIEAGFYYINVLLKYFNASPQWVFVVSSFIFSYFLLKSLPKKTGWLVFLITIALLYPFSLSGIRQASAIIINLFSIKYLLRRQYKYFIFFSFLAMTFHMSALVFVIAALTSLIPIKEYLKTHLMPIIFVVTIVGLFISSSFLIPYIIKFLQLLGLENYIRYFNNIYSRETIIGSGLSIISRLLFCIYFIITTKLLIKYDDKYWSIIILVFTYAVVTILATKIQIFIRLATGLSIILPVAAYLLVTLDSNKQLNKIVVFLLVITLSSIYIKETMTKEYYEFDPLLNPYRTIFHNQL